MPRRINAGMDAMTDHPLTLWRVERGLSLAAAAEHLGVSTQEIRAIEERRGSVIASIVEHKLATGADMRLHKLTVWRAVHGVSLPDFARRIGVTRMAQRRYELGERSPTWDIIDRIVIETGGEVTANDWLGKQAREVVAAKEGDDAE